MCRLIIVVVGLSRSVVFEDVVSNAQLDDDDNVSNALRGQAGLASSSS